MKKLIFTSFLLVSAVTISNAQNVGASNSNQAISIVIKNVFDMSLSSGKALTFSFDKLADYDSGVEVLNANTINYKTNKAWKVNVKALSREFMRGSGMPVNVISVRQAGAKDYVPVSVTDQEIGAGVRGASNFNIDYKANPGYSYESGTYAITLQYTLTDQ